MQSAILRPYLLRLWLGGTYEGRVLGSMTTVIMTQKSTHHPSEAVVMWRNLSPGGRALEERVQADQARPGVVRAREADRIPTTNRSSYLRSS